MMNRIKNHTVLIHYQKLLQAESRRRAQRRGEETFKGVYKGGMKEKPQDVQNQQGNKNVWQLQSLKGKQNHMSRTVRVFVKVSRVVVQERCQYRQTNQQKQSQPNQMSLQRFHIIKNNF
jgi:hypothetical protein